MDFEHVPRTFWHSISLSLLAATFGLLLVAYRSSSVSIEIANAKIELSSALGTTKEISAGLQQENHKLKAVRAELEEKIASLETALAEAEQTPSTRDMVRNISRNIKATKLQQPVVSKEKWTTLQMQIDNVESTIRHKK